MFIHFLDLLRSLFDWEIPSVFSYASTRMLLAAVSSLLMSIFLGPRFITLLYSFKIGQSIRKEHVPVLHELHKKKQDTPTMGGLRILASMLISLFLWMDLSHLFTHILLATTLVLGAIGGVDDYLKIRYRNSKGLPGRWKMVGQGALAVGLAWILIYHSGLSITEFSDGQAQSLSPSEYVQRLYLPFVKQPWIFPSGVAAAALMIFTVVGSSNAVNLTDGLDGLAAGCLVMVAMTFAAIAFVSNHFELARYLHILYIEGAAEIAIYLSAFVGACLGFLWYNGYPAQVFMGDTGSLTLGGIIGVSAVLLRKEFLLAIVGGIFVAEALSVILQVGSYRLRNKKRIFLCAPLHHHFEYKGWPETKVVLRFWIIGLLLAFIGIGSLKFQ